MKLMRTIGLCLAVSFLSSSCFKDEIEKCDLDYEFHTIYSYQKGNEVIEIDYLLSKDEIELIACEIANCDDCEIVESSFLFDMREVEYRDMTDDCDRWQFMSDPFTGDHMSVRYKSGNIAMITLGAGKSICLLVD